MQFLYNILAVCIMFAALPVFLYRLIREEGFGERLKQSFGFLPPEALAPVAGKNCLWLHAASVGEIVATSPIVRELRRAFPDQPLAVSVVTAHGYAMAKKIIPEADSIYYFPWDLPWLSRSVIKRIRPRLFILVETELWPNFLLAAHAMKIPVMMVNGRISDRSVERYRYLRGVLKDMLDSIARFCMQSTIDAQYIIRLGADPRRVYVTGNTKYDQTYTNVAPSEQAALAASLGMAGRRPVIVAGSTHRGEEELLLAAFERVKAEFPQAGLVLAPRDTQRAAELTALAASHGLAAARRTEPGLQTADPDVLVLDTIGELGQVYSLGEIVFVGGSLVPHGGHNLLEPAAHGRPILVGPHMFNFKDSYALLSGRGACETVYDGAELSEKILFLLTHDEARQAMSREALAIVRENQGAAQKSVTHIEQVLAQTKSR